jgi:hypothetical protein
VTGELSSSARTGKCRNEREVECLARLGPYDLVMIDSGEPLATM